MYEVSSEIYSEIDLQQTKCEDGRLISKFQFEYPAEDASSSTDKDGDIEVARKKLGTIEIEHSGSTILQLVGLQVWRGALLLADFFFHNRHHFADKHILELGAGVGLTSIAAGIFCKNVICTDVDIGGILQLIRKNVDRNRKFLKNNIKVMEFDFKSPEYLPELADAIEASDVIVAADVIYDDDLTECFIRVIDRILSNGAPRNKSIYIALEKRFVFTLDDLETCAPCYEHFLKIIHPKPWRIEYIPIDFPQYFKYERSKHLILFKVTNK
ncbi:methyltransferase-like protein 22 [Episyrphus balteatus]|uniref:methyltransferase-like protein 22 n=1 Tax=Episyrphus balteatus TaxID=286459 RepID=UPI0024864E1A|nr:methyltransferase-like protein 22 [Episyrphus balteatus]XP_055855240.1 methyltransferase-like protein 22 [Episyrphus balteatus]